eukprot:656261-Amorphochlora_amoeboformis.AAC.1
MQIGTVAAGGRDSRKSVTLEVDSLVEKQRVDLWCEMGIVGPLGRILRTTQCNESVQHGFCHMFRHSYNSPRMHKRMNVGSAGILKRITGVEMVSRHRRLHEVRCVLKGTITSQNST